MFFSYKGPYDGTDRISNSDLGGRFRSGYGLGGSRPFDVHGFDSYRPGPLNKNPAFDVREENWRSTSSLLQRGTVHRGSHEDWKRDGSTSWRSSERERKTRSSSSPERSDSRKRSRKRSPSPPKSILPAREHRRERSLTRGRTSTRRSDEKNDRRSVSAHTRKNALSEFDNEEELEKAAKLQLKLMAEMDSGKAEEGKPLDNESVTNSSEELKAKDETKKAKKLSSTESQRKINPPERGLPDEPTSGKKKQSPSVVNTDKQKLQKVHAENNNASEDKDASKRENEGSLVLKSNFEEIHQFPKERSVNNAAEKVQGGSLVVKKNFEDIHMFAKEKTIASTYYPWSHKPWIEQYKMTVNKRKELLSNLSASSPRLRPPTGSCGISPRSVPSATSRVADFAPETSSKLGGRPAGIEYFGEVGRDAPHTYVRGEGRRNVSREYYVNEKKEAGFWEYSGEQEKRVIPQGYRVEHERKSVPQKYLKEHEGRAAYHDPYEKIERRNMPPEYTGELEAGRRRAVAHEYIEEDDVVPREYTRRKERRVMTYEYLEERERRAEPREYPCEKEATLREYFQESGRRHDTAISGEYYGSSQRSSYKKELGKEVRARSKGVSIDPNQYVEELSDSEDWDQIAQPANKPMLKRCIDQTLDRPYKPGLLGPTPRLPRASSPVLAKRPRLPADVTPAFVPPPVLPIKNVTSSRPSMETKSFFRVEYPSVRPRIYYPKPPGKNNTNESEEVAPKRIAPAEPISPRASEVDGKIRFF